MAALPKLTVVKATYAKTSGADVSEKVRALMAKNGGNLVISGKDDFNQLFGDTEPKADKLFHLVYQYGPNGAQRSMTHAEKHVDIYLPALEIKAGQVLTVGVVKAIGLRDTRTLGKQNPYAKLKCGAEEFKTKVHEKGGTNAEWNQSFIFNLDGKDQFMHVIVYDKETISDDIIARFDIPLPTLAAATGEVAYNLVHPNDFKKAAGSIVFKCEFKDPNAPVVPQTAAAPAATATAAAPAAQPTIVYQQPQPQVVYMQQPQPVYQQPQVVYQQPQVVYQQPQPQPQVVYQQPQPQPQPVYQQPQVVYQQPAAAAAPSYSPSPSAAPSYSPSPAAYSGSPAAYTPSGAAPAALASNIGANQRFQYTSSGHLVGFDGRCLDVNEGSRAEGASLIYYDKANYDSPNQQWDYKDGYFMTRMGTGFVIDVSGGAANVKDGGSLILWSPAGSDNQKWDIDSNGFIRSRANPRFCIDVNGGAYPAKGMTAVSVWTAAA